VGNDVYKAYFADGSIPQMLYGKKMKEPEDKHTFFFFSDYRNLYDEKREEINQYWYSRLCDECHAFSQVIDEMKLR
jgi:hypothetical protein